MSNLDDLDTDGATDESAGEGPAALRAALKKANAALAEERAKNAQFAKTQRDSTLSAALQAAGARPSIAKYIPESVTDAAGVKSWLESNGEDFGYQANASASEQPAPTQTDASGSTVPDHIQKVFGRVQENERAGEVIQPNTDAEKRLAALDGAKSFDDAVKLLLG